MKARLSPTGNEKPPSWGGTRKLESIVFFFLTHSVCWDEVPGRRKYGVGMGRGVCEGFSWAGVGGGVHGNGGTNRNDTWQHHHSLKVVTDFRLSVLHNWIIWGKPLNMP